MSKNAVEEDLNTESKDEPSAISGPTSVSSVVRFLERGEDNGARTNRELEKTFREIERILSSLFAGIHIGNSESYEVKRKLLREHYLEKPLKRLERSNPPRRILMALGNYQQSLLEAASRLPDRVEDSLQNISHQLNQKPNKAAKVKPYFVRVPVHNLVVKQTEARGKVEDRIAFHAVVALDVVLCCWKAVVLESQESLDAQKLRWERAQAEADKSFKDWIALTTKQRESLPTLILKRISAKPGNQKLHNDHAQEHRDSQIRSLEGELHLASSIESCWDAALAELRSLEATLDRERNEIVQEMGFVAEWLKNLLAEEEPSADKLPPASVRALTLSSRKADLEHKLKGCSKPLPLNLSVISHLRVKPKARVKWNQLYPQETYRSALRLVRPSLEKGLETRVLETHQLLQGCDRVRDVIHFGLDLDVEEGSVVAKEALENALALLEHQLNETADTDTKLLPSSEEALVELFTDLCQSLNRIPSQASWYRVKRRFKYESRNLVEGTGSAAGRMGSRLSRAASRRTKSFLARIGFTKTDSTEAAIEIRSYLPAEFVHTEEKDLPAVYRRLFRIEPVEDARFLVGRAVELQAFEDALTLWKQNRPVSIILAGQRGSGKTSLLNCLNEQFHSFPVTRSCFRERLVDAKSLDRFLAKILKLDESKAIVPQLLVGERRIVIIEEMERTFLRHIGGYGAIRQLQNIIQATSRKILWVLAINEVSYGFLCRAVSLAQNFTHRIKTAVADRNDLKSAIMVRHDLSGLRLRFRSRFERPNRWRELRQRLNKAKEPESVFFDRLAAQSRGVYRTALEVWLGHIEAFEGGVLYMKQIADLELDDVVAELDVSDLFSLVAILQHGSLTPEEHSQVFNTSPEASTSQLDELVSRELLEDDPVHIGLRIRPEAMPVVKEALFRRNLL